MDIRAIQREFNTGLDELDPEGAIGIAAIQACAEVIARVRALDEGNAAETKAALQRLLQELTPVDQALAANRFPAALPIATGRIMDMLKATLDGLGA